MMCLMMLHNYCIGNISKTTHSTLDNDECNIRRIATSRGNTATSSNARAIQLDSRGIPLELVGGGHHFSDMPRQRRPEIFEESAIPMEEMRRGVALKGLKQPTVDKYTGKRKRNSDL